jgi:hypothetical protein
MLIIDRIVWFLQSAIAIIIVAAIVLMIISAIRSSFRCAVACVNSAA